MLFDLPAGDASLSYQLSFLVRSLDSEDRINVVRSRCEEIKPGVETCDWFPFTDLVCGHMVITWPDQALVLIQGSQTVAHGRGFVAGIDMETNFAYENGANVYLGVGATTVGGNLSLAGGATKLRTIIAGHSLGGAIGEVLAGRLNAIGMSGNLSLITFGSPRPGPVEFSRTLNGIDVCRWMTTLDVVPQIPPRQNQCPIFFMLLSQPGRLNANRYVQVRGGVVISDSGEVRNADVTDSVSPDLQYNLGAWLLALVRNASSPHNMSSYQSALLARRSETIGTVLVSSGTHGPGVPVADPPNIVRRQVAQTSSNLNSNVREGNQTATVIPKAKAFQYSKLGPSWCVFFNGEMVAIGPTRKKAGGLANRGNQFLRRLQTMGLNDPDALSGALLTYMRDASADGEGFSPVMRT